MKKTLYILPVVAVAVIGWCIANTFVIKASPIQADPEIQTKAIVAAANAFLKTLTADQLKTVQYEFLHPTVASATRFDMSKMGPGPGGPPPNGRPPGDNDSTHRPPGGGPGNNGRGPGNGQQGPPASGEQYGKAVWSNFPLNITARPGIELGNLNATQRAAATHLLQVVLSAKGYDKVQDIMWSDQALADGGTDVTAGADHYLIAIFGTPDANKPWMLEFGGHHLGLNIVIAGPHGALTPTLTGTQPAVYTLHGKTVRALAGENDKAFDLLNALNDDQRKKAILNYSVDDLVLGPGHDGQKIVPEGLKASEMTDKQKEILVSLIEEWAGIINSGYQLERMNDIRAGLNETYFAWSGPTTHADGKNGESYYRIQGPKVIIEFAPQGTFGDKTVHVHTIYRDPTNEYGSAFKTQ